MWAQMTQAHAMKVSVILKFHHNCVKCVPSGITLEKLEVTSCNLVAHNHKKAGLIDGFKQFINSMNFPPFQAWDLFPTFIPSPSLF